MSTIEQKFMGTINPWNELDTLKADYVAWERGEITQADILLKLANAGFSISYLLNKVQKGIK